MYGLPTDTTARYQINRHEYPALTLYWIAESIDLGRPVKLYGLSCIFCKKTLSEDFKGDITMIVNAPVNINLFSMAISLRCKHCKQEYRLIVNDSFLG